MQLNYTEKRDTLVSNPTTTTLTGTVDVNVDARKAWQLVGNFGGFNHFITGLHKIEMTGEGVRSVRKKFFEDGNVVIEQLNSHDDKNMVMTWSLIYTSFNIGNLWASMRVEPLSENSSRVTWDIAGEPWDMAAGGQPGFEEFVNGFLDMAMTNIKEILEAKTH